MFEKFKKNRQLTKLAKSDSWEDRAEAARRGYKPAIRNGQEHEKAQKMER